jgi:hypothetical protein
MQNSANQPNVPWISKVEGSRKTMERQNLCMGADWPTRPWTDSSVGNEVALCDAPARNPTHPLSLAIIMHVLDVAHTYLPR